MVIDIGTLPVINRTISEADFTKCMHLSFKTLCEKQNSLSRLECSISSSLPFLCPFLVHWGGQGAAVAWTAYCTAPETVLVD